MKNLLLTAAALVVLLSLGGCKGDSSHYSGFLSTKTFKCDEVFPLPRRCNANAQDCATDPLCRAALLVRHAVNDNAIHEYTAMGGPFEYGDLTFNHMLDNNNDCNSNFYFEVFKDNDIWYSNVSLDRYKNDKARRFPLPLMKALQWLYLDDPEFQELKFYWITNSPRCHFKNDVLIEVVLRNGESDFYDVSLPPVIGQHSDDPIPQGPNRVRQS